jgi:GxxExxY protein
MPESSYRKSLCHEFDLRGIPHECEVPIDIHYKGKLVGQGRIDILVGGSIILELKVVEALNDVHRAQALSYLKITKLKLVLLINFNVATLKDGIRRIINSH